MMGGKKKKKDEIAGLQTAKDKQQSLFVHQRFNCSGQLTSWIFAAEWDDGDRRTQFPELQIWRRESTGSSTYTKVSGTTAAVTSQRLSFVYTYSLDNPLTVSAGDVLCVYQPERGKSKLQLYFYESEEPVNEYFYEDKIKQSIESIDIDDAKSKRQLPLVTAVIGNKVNYKSHTDIQ